MTDRKKITDKQTSKDGSPLRLPKVGPEIWVVIGLSMPIAIATFVKFTYPMLSGEFGGPAEMVESLKFFWEDFYDIATHPCPRWISAREKKWISKPNEIPIKRYKNLSVKVYTELINQGEPFIVTDLMKGWPAFGVYNCSYMIENYPDAEYMDWQAGEVFPLGFIPKRTSSGVYDCAAGYMTMEWEKNKKYLKEWLEKVKTPEFMQDTKNLQADPQSITGFLGTPYTGVSPHLDETCGTLMTVQFSGTKLWTISWPELSESGQQLQWSRPYTFKLYPGEIMFWYMSQRHHTEVLDGCSFSLTFDIQTPAPVDYFKKLKNILNTVGQKERDRFYKEIEAADIRYMDKCHVEIDEETGQSIVVTKT